MKGLWHIGIVCWLLACGSGDVTPEGLIPREQFKVVLLEAQLIEARINHELGLGIHAMAPADAYYEELFKAQGITAKEFETTFQHYSELPEELRAIYEEIITELSRRKDEIRQ